MADNDSASDGAVMGRSATLLRMREQSVLDAKPPVITEEEEEESEKPEAKTRYCGMPRAVWAIVFFAGFILAFVVGGWEAWRQPTQESLATSTKALLREAEDRVSELASRDIGQAVDVVSVGHSTLLDGSFFQNLVSSNSSDVTTALYPPSNKTHPPAWAFWQTFEVMLQQFTVNSTIDLDKGKDDYSLTRGYGTTGFYMASAHQMIGVFYEKNARDGKRQLRYQTSDTKEIIAYDILDDEGTLSTTGTTLSSGAFDQTSRPWFQLNTKRPEWTQRYDYLQQRGLTVHDYRRVTLAPLPNGTRPGVEIIVAADLIPEYMQPALERARIPRKGCAFITIDEMSTVARTFEEGATAESAQEQYALGYLGDRLTQSYEPGEDGHAVIVKPHRTDDGYWVSALSVHASGGLEYKVVTVLDTEYSEEELRQMTTESNAIYLVVALVFAVAAFAIYEVPLATRERWLYRVVAAVSPSQCHAMRVRAQLRREALAAAVAQEEKARCELQVCESMVRTAEQELRDRRVHLLSEQMPLAREAWMQSVISKNTGAPHMAGIDETAFEDVDSLRQRVTVLGEMPADEVKAVEKLVEDHPSVQEMQALLDEARANQSRAEQHHARLFAKRLHARFELENTDKLLLSLPVNCPRLLLGAFLIVLVVWALHLASESLATFDFVDSTMLQAARRHMDVSNSYVQSARQVMELTLSRHDLGDMLALDDKVREPTLPPSGVEGPEFNYFDRFFVGTLNSYRNDSGGMLLDAVYLGRGDGRMIGATKAASGTTNAGWDITVMHRDTNDTAYYFTPARKLSFFRDTFAYEDGNLCFDPRDRNWYTMAVSRAQEVVTEFFEATGLSEVDMTGPKDSRWLDWIGRRRPGYLSQWTELYTYASGGLGITLATPLVDPSNSGVGANGDYYDTTVSKYVSGVFAIDIRLSVFDDVLRRTQLRVSPMKRLFLLQRSGRYLAGDLFNEKGEPFELTAEEIQAVVYGDDISDTVVRQTTAFLRQSGHLLPSVDANGDDSIGDFTGAGSIEVEEVPRAVDRAHTYVALVDDADGVVSSNPWLSVFAVPKQDGLYQWLYDDIMLSFITRFAVAIGCGIGIYYCLRVAWLDDELDERRSWHNQTRLAQKAARTDVAVVSELVNHEVTSSVHLAYDTCLRGNGDRQVKLQRAATHFNESSNIVTTCRLETMQSSRLLWLHRMRNTVWWTLGINVIALVHIILGFAEPDFFDEEDPHVAIVVIAGVCVALELLDWVTRALILWRTGTNLLGSDRTVQATLFHGALIVFFIVDVIMMCVGPRTELWLLALRPLLLLVTNESVAAVVASFWRTLTSAGMRTVLLLYLVVVAVAAAMGIVLFRRVLDDWSPGSVFSDFVRSMTTSFVFISTGDNYEELVYPAYEVSPWYTVYFIAFTVFGMFIILGMIVDRFQDGFEESYEQLHQRLQVTDDSRLIAAYAVLAKQEPVVGHVRADAEDANAEEEIEHLLSEDMFRDFLRRVMEVDADEDVDSLYERQDGASDSGLTKTEFVHHMRNMDDRMRELRQRQRQRELSTHALRKWVRDNLLTGWGGAAGVLLLKLVVLGEIVCMAYYGGADDVTHLDQILFFLLLAQVVEIGVKVFGWGWRGFIHHDTMHTPCLDRQMANRVDTFIVLLSLLLTVVTRLSTGRVLSYKEEDDSLRFALTLCILRLFTLIVSLRRLVFSLAKIVPQFVSMLLVLLGVFYVYGVMGIYLFGDEYSRLQEDRLPEARFESLPYAFIALFHLLVAGWHDVMYAAIMSTSWTASVYFMSYTIIVTLFFSNLFIGLVLNSQKEQFEDATADEEDEEEQLQHLLYAHVSAEPQPSVFELHGEQGVRELEMDGMQ
ncbi:MAG: hypothetical protein MHM6MM_004502 [Cercozoa sp. M6MM]